MCELKRFDIVGKYADEETMYEFRPDGECYDADEVDKKIAEFKTEIKLHMYIERHHKYKRCLAMAEACKHKRWRADVCDEYGFDYARSTKHMNKWLKIAEKFKEDKCR